MSGFTNKILMLSVCGALSVPAFAQTVDVKGATAGATAKTESGVTADGKNTTAGIATLPDGEKAPGSGDDRVARIVPKPTPNGGAGSMAPLNGNQSGVTSRGNMPRGQSPTAQATRSSESTARKTVYDPNNQLGTSLQGTTKPIPGAESNGPAPNDTSPPTGAATNAQ